MSDGTPRDLAGFVDAFEANVRRWDELCAERDALAARVKELEWQLNAAHNAAQSHAGIALDKMNERDAIAGQVAGLREALEAERDHGKDECWRSPEAMEAGTEGPCSTCDVLSDTSTTARDFEARVRREALEEARVAGVAAVCGVGDECGDTMCSGAQVSKAIRALATPPKPEHPFKAKLDALGDLQSTALASGAQPKPEGEAP